MMGRAEDKKVPCLENGKPASQTWFSRACVAYLPIGAEPVMPDVPVLLSAGGVVMSGLLVPLFIVPLFVVLPPVMLLPDVPELPVDVAPCLPDFAFGCGCDVVRVLAALPSVPLMLSCVLLAAVPLVLALPGPVWANANVVAEARMAAAMIDLFMAMSCSD
jgi:hypothetical protein